MGKPGRPRTEETTMSAVRMPVRLWRLLSKAAKGYRTRNELIVRLVESHLVENGLLNNSERKFPIESKNNKTKE
jgi:hypothetical protein